MRQIESPGFRTSTILGYVFVLCLSLCSSVSNAQSVANFAGQWIQDTVKSDKFYKGFEVKYTITQTPQAFTVKQIFTIESSKESVINEDTYTLDGKVKIVETENGKANNSIKWSADKKILTTRSTIFYGTQEVGYTESYSLSNDGLVLTVEKSDIIPGALSIKMVFNKKQ